MSNATEDCDVLIVGGGPAGATAGIILARAGKRVILLEKTRFPRFHIGESFLPRTFRLIQELGLEPALRKLPHVPKFGAEFVTADGVHDLCFDFAQGFSPTDETFNIERAAFDEMLLEQARLANTDVRQDVAARQIIALADGDVRVLCDTGEIRARWLIDASGQNTLVGRHLGTRKTADEPHLQKAAYFSHFTNVRRTAGRRGGHPLIVMVDEGWFWMIPLDEKRTSVGLVMDPDISRRVQRDTGLSADRMLSWGIERCPAVAERMVAAAGPETNHVAADFSYRCRPYAGPGYFLVGDAAAFMDPIFSTGVCVAMTGSAAVARSVLGILDGKLSASRCRAAHIKLLENSTATLFKIIRQYYDHSFRELFLNGTGPLDVHRAVIGVLAGNVFPAPWRLRWRLGLFNLCVAVNRLVPLVTRRERHSLLAHQPLQVGT